MPSYRYRPNHPQADEFGMVDTSLLYGEPRSAPGVISDTQPMLEHPAYADGRRTDSKSTFRRWTRDAGCVEKGNERTPQKPVRDDNTHAAVKQAIEQLRSGYKPNTSQKIDGWSRDGWH